MAASAAAGRVENVDVCQEADKSFPMYYKELNCLDRIKYRKIDDFFSFGWRQDRGGFR